ncbi:MAG TPA: response regulator [Candidatus Saccharimonas sp.]|nr:response regulator [Candidatus Saccharimonas sp.]
MATATHTLMVVEDEALLLQAISHKLEMTGLKVLPFVNGNQALDYLRQDKPLPDCIWLDYYLQDSNGLEFMEEYAKHPDWAKVPVAVVSNSASDDKVKKMLALGARQYVLKAEHRLEDIVAIVQRLIDEGAKAT